MPLVTMGDALTSGAREKLREAVRARFPRIPVTDLDAVVSWSVRKGYAPKILLVSPGELVAQVEAAVAARVRHTRTDYDEILVHSSEWSDEARRKAALASVACEVEHILQRWS